MASYNSPYALYTPQNPAATLALGFQTGIGVRRNIEETAKLIHEREEKEQSQKAIQEAMDGINKAEEARKYKEAYALNLLGRQQDGHGVNPADLATAAREAMMATTDVIARYDAAGEQLYGTGLPTAIDMGKHLHDRSSKMRENLASFEQSFRAQKTAERGQDIGQDIADDDRTAQGERLDKQLDANAVEGAATRQNQQDISNANNATQKSIADANNATQLQDTGIREAGADRRQGAELDSRENEGRKERELRQEQFGAQLKFQRSQVETPAKKMADLREYGSGIMAFRNSGMSNKQINQLLPKGAPTAEDFDTIYSALSEETAAKLKKAEQHLIKLTKRQEEDPKADLKQQIQRATEYVKQLRVVEDQNADAEIEWEQYKLDSSAAEARGAEFGRFLDKAAESTAATVASPFTWLEGLITGPGARKPDKEARRVSRGEDY